jgi:hypothetical protein
MDDDALCQRYTLRQPRFFESQAMSTAEEILKELQTLPEAQAREVLDFVAFLKTRRARGKSVQQDMSAFDRFGAVYEGPFNRDELYDRKVLR